jgi:hypothetical protein
MSHFITAGWGRLPQSGDDLLLETGLGARLHAVSADYTTASSKFNGKINWVQIDLGKDDHDHLISPEERLRVAMARQ